MSLSSQGLGLEGMALWPEREHMAGKIVAHRN